MPLLEKRKILSSLEKIKDALYSVHSLITGDEKAYDLLRACLNKLGAVCDLSSDYSSLYDRLNSVLVELDDIGETSYDILDKLDLNEEELSKIEDRLDLIKTLKRKYGNSYEGIIEYLQNIKIKCENIENFSQKHSELSNQIDLLKNKLNIEYKKLTKLRKEYAVKFSSSVILELVELNMKNAKFDVLVSNNNLELSLNGVDTVEFMFSANSGEPLKNMAKIISGGEMSRFMLALKLVCSNQEIETLIFDEIDAGISGTTGEIVAEKFSKLSKQKQVITISHLPQMVAMADNSYQIKKVEENAITKTNINLLDENGKINEIIRLIGGSADSINAINHAKDMINIANDYKKTI